MYGLGKPYPLPTFPGSLFHESNQNATVLPSPMLHSIHMLKKCLIFCNWFQMIEPLISQMLGPWPNVPLLLSCWIWPPINTLNPNKNSCYSKDKKWIKMQWKEYLNRITAWKHKNKIRGLARFIGNRLLGLHQIYKAQFEFLLDGFWILLQIEFWCISTFLLTGAFCRISVIILSS